MHNDSMNYILKEFIDIGYIEPETGIYELTETQDSGKTRLRLEIQDENLCLKNYDKKNRCGFWKRSKATGLSKCVDHVILQHTKNGWILHLIEMKGRVDNLKWFDIRLKNRASYLDIKALACILGIEKFERVYSYTTYREDCFQNKADGTNPRAKVAFLGKRKIDPFKEWTTGKMYVQIGLNEELVFYHRSMQMEDENGVLVGSLKIYNKEER